jgi:hypothetical protein
METNDRDLDAISEAILNHDTHAIQHVNAWAEVNAIRDDLTATQDQVDALYSMVLQLAGVLNNQVLPVPIAFDALEKE